MLLFKLLFNVLQFQIASLVGVLLISFYTVQVNCKVLIFLFLWVLCVSYSKFFKSKKTEGTVLAKLQVDRYSLDILERGTEFKEILEVDVDNQTEVFRVPQHNDVDAMDMMNDFNLVSVWSKTEGPLQKDVPLSSKKYRLLVCSEGLGL